MISYDKKFGRHVPASALRLPDARDLAPILRHSLLAYHPRTGWELASTLEFGLRGCGADKDAKIATLTKPPRANGGTTGGRSSAYA
jgi:hypothetical protein